MPREGEALAQDEVARLRQLQEIIRDRGRIPFDRYMEACLYEPRLGYYANSTVDPGRAGDFFTSVSVGPVFGRLLADLVLDQWLNEAGTEDLFIVEQGAHGGALAKDVLDTLKKNQPEQYARCRYGIVEPIEGLEKRQQRLLSEHASQVFWVKQFSELGQRKERTFFLSNELVDSFPVKRIRYQQGQWQECWVQWSEEQEGFALLWLELEDSELRQEIVRWQIPCLEGYEAEINLRAARWMQDLSAQLGSGWILTMDYGYVAEELYAPWRPQGTLSCYHNHQRDENPLVSVGEKDITTQINFSLLEEMGARAGWQKIFFEDQHHALIRIAQKKFLPELEERMKKSLLPDEQAQARREIGQFQTLTHPSIMGTQFKFLLQRK
jgi:SAM-dependent MidA family methyltransferase